MLVGGGGYGDDAEAMLDKMWYNKIDVIVVESHEI